MSGEPLDPDGGIDRRSMLKAIGATAAAGAAIGTASAGDCWTETDCRDHRCQTHYPCRVYERTCCWDGGTVVCSEWESTASCCSDC